MQKAIEQLPQVPKYLSLHIDNAAKPNIMLYSYFYFHSRLFTEKGFKFLQQGALATRVEHLKPTL